MTRTDVDRQLEEVLETLAAVEHERWAHWQKYMHGKCRRMDHGSLLIPADLVNRWDEQIATPYADLSEEEKESDRQQVRKYLSIIANALKSGRS